MRDVGLLNYVLKVLYSTALVFYAYKVP